MQSASYETYEDLYDQAAQGCEALRETHLRDMTSKQKFSTRARYRRRSTGASGSHRRRLKQSCC